MPFIANTTASFYRGQSETVDGDLVDTNEVLAKGVPVSITKKMRTVYNPNTGEPRVVSHYAGRVNPNFEVHVGDRVKDERTGKFYRVEDMATGASLAQFTSVTIELREE